MCPCLSFCYTWTITLKLDLWRQLIIAAPYLICHVVLDIHTSTETHNYRQNPLMFCSALDKWLLFTPRTNTWVRSTLFIWKGSAVASATYLCGVSLFWNALHTPVLKRSSFCQVFASMVSVQCWSQLFTLCNPCTVIILFVCFKGRSEWGPGVHMLIVMASHWPQVQLSLACESMWL